MTKTILIDDRHQEEDVMERLHQILRGRRFGHLLHGNGPAKSPDANYWILDGSNDWFAQWLEIDPATGKRQLRIWDRYSVAHLFEPFTAWVEACLNR